MEYNIKITTGEYHLILDALRMRQNGCKEGSIQYKKLSALWLKIYQQTQTN
jgi:hypothetical protein